MSAPTEIISESDDPRIPSVATPGEVLAGKYRIERLIGVGGMGVVLVAQHTELEKRVAIKLLHRHVLAHPDFVRRFLKEARTAASLRSEHVARVLDVDKGPDGTPFMVLEYLEGADLAALLQNKGPLPPAEAVGHVLEAMEALAEAHGLGLVHRDLKPANLFVATRSDGSPITKVLDFGICKDSAPSSTKLTAPHQLLGSPSYMSPEQILGEQAIDLRTDIWALGVVLYELLTATLPFEGATLASLSVQITTASPQPLQSRRDSIPEGLAAIVARCLEKSPSRRFSNTAELAEALLPFAPEHVKPCVARIRRLQPSGAPSTLPPQSAQTDSPAATAKSSVTLSSFSTSVSAKRRASRRWILGIGVVLVVGLAAVVLSLTGSDAASQKPEITVHSAGSIQTAVSAASTPPLHGSAMPPASAAAAVSTAESRVTEGPGDDMSSRETDSDVKSVASAKKKAGPAPTRRDAPSSRQNPPHAAPHRNPLDLSLK